MQLNGNHGTSMDNMGYSVCIANWWAASLKLLKFKSTLVMSKLYETNNETRGA